MRIIATRACRGLVAAWWPAGGTAGAYIYKCTAIRGVFGRFIPYAYMLSALSCYKPLYARREHATGRDLARYLDASSRHDSQLISTLAGVDATRAAARREAAASSNNIQRMIADLIAVCTCYS